MNAKTRRRTADRRRFTQIVSASITLIHKLLAIDFWMELIHFFGDVRERSHDPTPNLGQIFLT
jgi:hypothetical protein